MENTNQIINAILNPRGRVEHYLRYYIGQTLAAQMRRSINEIAQTATVSISAQRKEREWQCTVENHWGNALRGLCNSCLKSCFFASWIKKYSDHTQYFESIMAPSFEWRHFLHNEAFARSIAMQVISFHRDETITMPPCCHKSFNNNL